MKFLKNFKILKIYHTVAYVWDEFYTVVTLKSTGSDDVKSGFVLPLLEEAEVFGGGVMAIGLLSRGGVNIRPELTRSEEGGVNILPE